MSPLRRIRGGSQVRVHAEHEVEVGCWFTESSSSSGPATEGLCSSRAAALAVKAAERVLRSYDEIGLLAWTTVGSKSQAISTYRVPQALWAEVRGRIETAVKKATEPTLF